MEKQQLHTHRAAEKGTKAASSVLSWGRPPLPCHATPASCIITLRQITSHLGTAPARGISSSCHSPLGSSASPPLGLLSLSPEAAGETPE